MEPIGEQTAFGHAAGIEGRFPVSFCQLQQLSLCSSPSSFSHSSGLSRRKDTFPAEETCGIPSPVVEYGNNLFTAAALVRCCVFGHVPALSVSTPSLESGTGPETHAPPFTAESAEDSQPLQVQLPAAGIHTL